MRLAVITAVYNEADLLPQFLDYYCPQVDAVFLLDNESTDGSLAAVAGRPNVTVERFSTGGQVNTRIKCEAIEARRAACVGKFDYVLPVDVDEFVVPRRGGPLRDALIHLPRLRVHGTVGYNMAPGPDEGPYDPARPLLEQRRWGIAAPAYGKPIIVRPGAWVYYDYGFHRAVDLLRRPIVPKTRAFFLLHYIWPDEEIFVRRRYHGRMRRLSEENRRRGLGVHYAAGDEAAVRNEFRAAMRSPELVRVPPRELAVGAHP